MLLETYTSLEGEHLKNILPRFLNIEKQVTGCPDYSMYNLSLKEEWNNTKKFCRSLHGKQFCKCVQVDGQQVDQESPADISLSVKRDENPSLSTKDYEN